MPALDFDAFLRSLKRGEILPAYYFHGDEDLLKDDAVRDLLAAALDPPPRAFNLDRRRGPELTAQDFTTLALTPPVLTARRAVVIGEAEALQQRRPEGQALRAAVVGCLERPSPETLLILVQSPDEKPDAELARRAASVAFRALPPERIRRWIQHRAQAEGLEIDDDGAPHPHAAGERRGRSGGRAPRRDGVRLRGRGPGAAPCRVRRDDSAPAERSRQHGRASRLVARDGAHRRGAGARALGRRGGGGGGAGGAVQGDAGSAGGGGAR